MLGIITSFTRTLTNKSRALYSPVCARKIGNDLLVRDGIINKLICSGRRSTLFRHHSKRRYNSHSGGYSRNNFFSDSSNKQQTVFYGIIGVNLAVFGAWIYSEEDYFMHAAMMRHFTLSTKNVYVYHNFHTLVTSIFSHREPMHLLVNMLVFWSFGRNVLSILGTTQFLALYLGGGLVSSFCQLHWKDYIPRSWPAYYRYNRDAAGMGASGAVNALLAWHVLTFPWSSIYLYGLLPVPSALVGAGLVGMDLWHMYYADSNVGNAAHLGGVAFGSTFFFLKRYSRHLTRLIR
jgi:membrane associated rhomboid family serine protease